MSFAVTAFLTLFVVIDPVGLMPIFITLAGKYPAEQQDRIARQAVVVAAAILLVFALLGKWLLAYLEISIEAFQVTGGILLLKIAVDMVFARVEEKTAEEEKEERPSENVSIFPLAIPLLAGPGSFASLLILTAEANDPLSLVIILAIAAVVLLIAYVLFRLSKQLANFLGQTGILVVTRLLGILLAALAVQYIIDGAIVVLRNAVGLSQA